MAVEGIGNLVHNLADHLFGQGPAVQAGTRILSTRDAGSPAATEDTFTPSTQSAAQATAQVAGIFQLITGAVTAVAPGILATQAAPNTDQISSPQDANASGADAAQPQPTGTAGASGTNISSNAAAEQSAAGPAASAEVQNKIQQLNASLPALGLTNNEIQQIDRIASLINDFNPSAYTDLVNQFEARSQESGQQNSVGTALGSAPIIGSGSTSSPGANGTNKSSQAQLMVLSPLVQSQGQPVDGEQSSTSNPAAPNGNSTVAATPAMLNTLPSATQQPPQPQGPHPATNSGMANSPAV